MFFEVYDTDSHAGHKGNKTKHNTEHLTNNASRNIGLNCNGFRRTNHYGETFNYTDRDIYILNIY